jgi:hypothetical protein
MAMNPVLLTCASRGSLRPETLLAVRAQAPDFMLVECPGDFDYFAALKALWIVGRPFVVVEQDVVPHDGALAELLACPEPWCAFPYTVGWSRPCLGCTKLDPQQLGRDLLAGVPEPGWPHIDRLLERLLAPRRYHVHEPAVGHLHYQPDPWPRALATRGRIARQRVALGVLH